MSPFARWLPMYHPNAVADRPWWRASARGSVAARCDGWSPPVSTVEEMDAFDDGSPLPVPPAMPGQVWSDPTNGEVQVLSVSARDSALLVGLELAESPLRVNHHLDWPPPGAVLVAGPTPWGRDVPWAPLGWRP